MANSNVFIPDAQLSLLSPILAEVAAWPDFGWPLTLPKPDNRHHPPREAFDELEYLTTKWLNSSLLRADFRGSCGLDDDYHLTVRLGTTEQEWADSAAARAEYRKRHPGFVEPVRVEGFASAQRHLLVETFSFALGWARPMGDVDDTALLSRLKRVVPEALFDELMRPASTPQKHPSINARGGYAATAMLDRDGHGGIFPYLYLYATPDRLVGVYQQVPHTSL